MSTDVYKYKKTGRFFYSIGGGNISPGIIYTLADFQEIIDSDFTLYEISADFHVSYEIVLEQLQATVDIPELGLSPIPNFKPQDGEAEKQAKLIEIQKKYPKYIMRLHEWHPSQYWVKSCDIVIQNKGNEYYLYMLTPYLVLNEVLLLGKADKIGFSFIDVGWGVPKDGEEIIIRGGYRLDCCLIPKVLGVFGAVLQGLPDTSN